MPVFDSSTSKPSRAEAELLHGVLGSANPRLTSLQQASRAYRRRQTRAKIVRALVAVALLGGFFGSAFVISGNSPLPRVAAPTLPAPFDPIATGSLAVTTAICRQRLRDAAGTNGGANVCPDASRQ
jgi:hypothetical protein